MTVPQIGVGRDYCIWESCASAGTLAPALIDRQRRLIHRRDLLAQFKHA